MRSACWTDLTLLADGDCLPSCAVLLRRKEDVRDGGVEADEGGLVDGVRARLEDRERCNKSFCVDKADFRAVVDVDREDVGETCCDEADRLEGVTFRFAEVDADVDRGIPDGNEKGLGGGEDTVWGLSRMVPPAASSAAFAFRFSASI